MNYRYYVRVTGKSQGLFKAETPEAGEGLSRCHHFRFKAIAKNDPTLRNEGSAHVHEPITILKPWGPASPLFMTAFWTSEVLEVVHFLFVKADGRGNPEAPHVEVELRQATIASIALVAGEGTNVPEGAPAEFEEISFRFEEMTFKNVLAKTMAHYDWKNRA
jgi:type VI secretion system Hcp family effector